jgi:uncharacterized protein DUF1707/cell wall-active antibiotic response 4TMS protein YvqF
MPESSSTSVRTGSSSTPSAPSAVLPGLAARERVVDLLQLRFADDCLSMDEFERRVAVAYQARTIAELDELAADLAPAAPTGPGVPATGRIVTILSNNERGGPMPVPRRLEIVAVLGNVELDLSEATFDVGVTEIDISAVFGNVELNIPTGLRVESTGNAFLGNFDHKPTPAIGYPRNSDRIIRITGHAVFSSVEIGTVPARAMHADDAPRRLT